MVFTATEPVKVVAEMYDTWSPVVVTSPAVKIPFVPEIFTAPSAVISPAPIIPTTFDPIKVTTPPPVVVIELFIAKFGAFKVTPAAVLVLTAPLRVVVPNPKS